jgi:hypothetical protein
MPKHPHGTHIMLFLVLLACELFLFGGHGMLYQMGKIGLDYATIYSEAMNGMTSDFSQLLNGIIGLIATLVIYYLIAGAVVLIFQLFRTKSPSS